jgi:hypothetical protein
MTHPSASCLSLEASQPGRVGSPVAETWVEPVGGPLPDVAGGVEEPEAVRRECAHRCGAEESVLHRVPRREVALPHVHAVLAARLYLVAPRERLPLEPATGCALPFSLSRKALPRPRRVRSRVVPRHMDDRVVDVGFDR